MVFQVYKLSSSNCNKVKKLYQDFEAKAVEKYGFEYFPIDFDTFCAAISQKLLHSLVLYDEKEPEAILIYSLSDIDHTIEINVVHSLCEDNPAEKNSLLLKSLINFLDPKKFTLISYPMLGHQSDFTRYISNLNFKLVSQVIFRFNLDNKSSLKIFGSKKVAVPDKLKLVRWNDKFFEATVPLVLSAFQNSADALYDRRFKNLEGCEDVLEKITKSIYGELLKDASFLLLDNDKPVAFCFANLSSPSIANIPLVGCQKEYTSMGLGSFLLKQSVGKIIENVVNAQSPIVEVNATASAENNSSMRMYRSLGFKEDQSYTHSYYEL